ncbi:MAG: hypothetical protein ABJG88_01970 [Litorimonas sp.]
MKTLSSVIGAAILTAAFGSNAFASSPDVYVVNFRNTSDTNSQQLDAQLASAMAIAGVNAEEVVIDTSTAAKWEKGAHEAFDRDIVPIFNKWVGLPGFAAVVDANSKRVIGCVNAGSSASQVANSIRELSARASGSASLSRASTGTTRCPAAHNVDPGL